LLAWLALAEGAAAHDAAAIKPEAVAMHGAKSVANTTNSSASNGLVENSCAVIAATSPMKNTMFIKKNAYKKTTLDSSTKTTTATRMRRIALAFCS
jgi:CMP-N-acetylneuraminic acid synthetase